MLIRRQSSPGRATSIAFQGIDRAFGKVYKALDKWLVPYWRSVLRRRRSAGRPIHVLFCICDHFEPLSPHGAKPHDVGVVRVARWHKEYPALADQFRDADGVRPRHTFFFPAEEHHPDFLQPLAELTTRGLAEVEIHLHHRDDTADTLRDKLADFRDLLRKDYGLLGSRREECAEGARNRGPGVSESERSGPPVNGVPSGPKTRQEGEDSAPRSALRAPSLPPPAYAFIHGNWALCNSRPDGDWCGVDNEIGVLIETGCYADMTFPSIPSPTQPRRFCNRIYLARDRGRRSHDHGRIVAVGCGPSSGELMMIQGPVALNWRWRKFGFLPRIEHADLCASNPPTPQRADLWIRQAVSVVGREEWVFVKLHTHGCIERNTAVLLGKPMREMHEYLCHRYNDGGNYSLHYVSAREMANIAHAAIDGKTGNPGDYRDYVIGPPPIVDKM